MLVILKVSALDDDLDEAESSSDEEMETQVSSIKEINDAVGDDDSLFVLKGTYKIASMRWLLSLTPSRREYYIFSGPPYGIIFSENSEKISSH